MSLLGHKSKNLAERFDFRSCFCLKILENQPLQENNPFLKLYLKPFEIYKYQ